MDSKNNNLSNRLFEAINRGDVDAVRQLCDGSDGTYLQDITCPNGDSPLTAAATSQDFEVCKCLINDCGASVMELNRTGRTPLMEMIHGRDGTWKSKLLVLFKDSVNCRDSQGKTALMYAAVGAGMFGSRRGNLKITSDLIALGADTLAVDKNGVTALGWALKSDGNTAQNSEIITYLKGEMKNQAAMESFRREYKYRFNEKGVLELEKVVNEESATVHPKRKAAKRGNSIEF